MVNLTEDLVKAVLGIIDLSSSKGIFTGVNLTVAGQVRQELQNALDQAEQTKKVTKSGESK